MSQVGELQGLGLSALELPLRGGVLSAQFPPQRLEVVCTILRSGQHDGDRLERGQENQSLAGSQFQAGVTLAASGGCGGLSGMLGVSGQLKGRLHPIDVIVLLSVCG